MFATPSIIVSRCRVICCVVLLGLPLLRTPTASAELPPEGPRPVLRLDSDPAYELRKKFHKFDERLLPLWMSALDRPERELHREVADALIQAKRLGMPGLDESVAEKLLAVFKEADHPVVRRSLAAALVELDYREAADALSDACRAGDYQLSLIAEPALGRWRHGPTLDAALARLEAPNSPAPLVRIAINTLAAAEHEPARDPLLKITADRKVRSDLRLAAAQTLGTIATSGLVSEARALDERSRSDDPLAGVLAVSLLTRHEGEDTVALLQKLARDPNNGVQARALVRLGEIDQRLTAEFALDPELRTTYSVRHPDANVRHALIEALYSIGELASIPILRTFFDDPHPVNRTAAADAVFALAGRGDDFRRSAEEQLLDALGDDSWRTLERAALVTGGLDFEAPAERLVELLPHPRAEVAVAAAWGLKELSVAETLPAALQRVEQNLGVMMITEFEESERLGLQTAHLNEFFGLTSFAPADGTLRRFIPKGFTYDVVHHPEARTAAIWSLGRLHEDAPVPELTQLFSGRLNDVDSMPPELERVREGAAYGLGWMRDPAALPILRQHGTRAGVTRGPSPAAAWAIERITGEALPLPDAFEMGGPRWFLRPAKPPTAAE